MNVLVIGRGGREHAIVKTLYRDSNVDTIFCAPGNDGMVEAIQVPLQETDNQALVTFAKENKIDLTIVGPENSLMAGIVNDFEEAGLKIFGPKKEAALIEGSKAFAKYMMHKYNIPTASYEEFTEIKPAIEYVQTQSFPIVIKADGLAAGKGVVICETRQEAEKTLHDMLVNKQFASASSKVIIEEFLDGEEFSLMAFVSNQNYAPMPIARDYKRAFDNDQGLNTGGMGNHSPHPLITTKDYEEAIEGVIKPMTQAMLMEGIPFTGILYAGLMKTAQGIKVIEFNARFGDPETEVILPLLKTNLTDVLGSLLNDTPVDCCFETEATVGVVLAAKGYPEQYQIGAVIEGLELLEDVEIIHMGTKLINDKLTINGGRVLLIVGSGENLTVARDKVYRELEKIKCEALFYRTDIALHLN